MRRRIEPALFVSALAVAGLFAWRVDRGVGGLEFPVDDTYIYLLYARNFAHGHLYTYWVRDGYAPGCTSPLYPLLLVPGFWLGLDGAGMIPYVWVVCALLIAGCAALAGRIGRHFAGPVGALAAGGLLLAGGAWLWGALSGLEISLFTFLALLAGWLLIRDAGAGDGAPSAGLALASSGLPRERESMEEAPSGVARRLWLVAALLAVARPEGLPVAAALLACVILRRGRRSRPLSWLSWPLALAPYLAVGLMNRRFTGHSVPNTALYKSALFFPRQSFDHLLKGASIWLSHLGDALLFGLDGRVLLPLGALTVVIALGWLAWRTVLELRAATAFPATWLLMAILVQVPPVLLAQNPSQFYRYYHVAFALVAMACGIGLAAAVEGARARLSADAGRLLAPALVAVIGLSAASQWRVWMDAFVRSCDEIRNQQVKMAHWIDARLPGASLLLNDVGAIIYLTRRPGIDLVGLATNHQAESFIEGHGATFERFEHLSPAERPTHAVVYPEWLEIDQILGRELYRATLDHDPVSVAYRDAILFEADWSTLGSGTLPTTPLPVGKVIDAVDVADLEDEAAHRYDYRVPDAERGRRFSTLLGDHTGPDGRRVVDGGRRVALAEAFDVDVPALPVAGLRTRIEAPEPVLFQIRVDDRPAAVVNLTAQPGFLEVDVELPPLTAGRHRIEVRPKPGTAYRAFHYWVWGGERPAVPGAGDVRRTDAPE